MLLFPFYFELLIFGGYGHSDLWYGAQFKPFLDSFLTIQVTINYRCKVDTQLQYNISYVCMNESSSSIILGMFWIFLFETKIFDDCWCNNT